MTLSLLWKGLRVHATLDDAGRWSGPDELVAALEATFPAEHFPDPDAQLAAAAARFAREDDEETP